MADPSELTEEDQVLEQLEAGRLLALGHVEKDLCNYEAAVTCYRAALQIYQKYGDRRNIGASLGNIGSIVLAQDQFEAAIDLYSQAIDIFQEVGAKRSVGTYVGNLGNAYVALGQLSRAQELPWMVARPADPTDLPRLCAQLREQLLALRNAN